MGKTTGSGGRPPDICILGLGYIGLPTAAVLARAGLTVHGVDTSVAVVDTINRGCIHIEEPGLESLVREMVDVGRIVASTSPPGADVFLIAVPTPCDEAHRPDLSAVEAAALSLARVLVPGNLVVLESTCPIGTTERVRDILADARPDLAWPGRSDAPDIHVAYCPERVLPGRVLQELVANSRSIGGLDDASTTAARAFYRLFVAGECVATTARTAEMVKLMENASRDVSIAFANELSLVAERVGVDVWEAIALANRHPRVNILKPGPGVGGHCIAVDPWFLVAAAPDLTPLMRTARAVNDGKAKHVVDRAAALLDQHPEARLACLGLTFKADVDDLRESPALSIATTLAERYADRIRLVDPHVVALPSAIVQTGARLVTLSEALADCALGLMLVDHAEFHGLRWSRFVASYDCRGVWRDGGHWPPALQDRSTPRTKRVAA